MLVLSRRIQESIHLSDSIVVQVLSIKGDRVQLGFSAPREIRIWRSELMSPLSNQTDAHGTSPSVGLDRGAPPAKKRSRKPAAMAVSAHRHAS